jgi:DNA-binding NarL/FixJ family response regulator
MPSVRLLVAGGHEILRIGVRAILANNPDWTVVAEASDSRQAIEKAKEFRPDIAILDFSMTGTNGFDATQEIVKNLPDTKVVMLTIYDGDKLIDEMQRAGAHGCLRKADVSRDLIRAITAVMKNRTFYAPETATSTLRLTTRQREIVELLAQGRTSAEVAASLGISTKTVETHKSNIHLRTHCHTMAHLVRYAIRNGIIVA